MRKNIVLISLLLALSACSSSTKAKMGLQKTGPNENTVVTQQSLKIPPILTELPKPQESVSK